MFISLFAEASATLKDNGYEVTDHIKIFVNASRETLETLQNYDKDICAGTLAENLVVGENGEMQEVELNGENIKLRLEKTN